MLEKTMKQILNKKVNQWLDSINNDEIKNIIKENLIITGGCFTSFIQNEIPKDYDCYLKTKEAVYKVACYYADKWNEVHKGQKNKLGYETKVFVLDGENPSQEILDYFNVKEKNNSDAILLSNCDKDRIKMVFPSDGIVGNPEDVRYIEELGIDELSPDEIVKELDEIDSEKIEKEKKPYFPVFISSNAITLSNDIQFIVRFYGSYKDIHDTYDFEHCKAFFDFSSNELNISKDVYELTINKTLKYTGSKYPVCSMFRTRKFIQRGWKINAGQMLKIAYQISDLNLNDINILEDQLIGVDSLYFMSLIHQFKNQQKNDVNFDVTSEYVISIIDKIF